VLGHRSSRPPTHTLTSLSRTDPLHTLPLTTSALALRCAARPGSWRPVDEQPNLLGKHFHIVRILRPSRPLAVMEAAHLSAVCNRTALKCGGMSAALRVRYGPAFVRVRCTVCRANGARLTYLHSYVSVTAIVILRCTVAKVLAMERFG
jgi:hypothetical protein